jgi:hypothetical protein
MEGRLRFTEGLTVWIQGGFDGLALLILRKIGLQWVVRLGFLEGLNLWVYWGFDGSDLERVWRLGSTEGLKAWGLGNLGLLRIVRFEFTYAAVSNGKQKTEAHEMIFPNPFTVCSSCKEKLSVCKWTKRTCSSTYGYRNARFAKKTEVCRACCV